MSGKYDFDTVTDRRGTACLKYDFANQFIGRDDLIPLWVADMDFPLPAEILDPVHKRLAHGIFGYSGADDRYYDAMEDWFMRRHGWQIDREWNTTVPGVVFGIAAAINAFTEPGNAILIQEPVYYPFRGTIKENNRVCVNNQLKEVNGRYEIDFEDFENKLTKNEVKAFILCSPHNPVGRVWTREELTRMGELCLKHGVLVIVDEIHSDIIYPGNQFIPYGTLGEELAGQAVICTAPSKTFNIAGLQISNILIPDPELRRQYRHQINRVGYGQCNVIGMVCAEAVYEKGDEWLDELLEYLEGNLSCVRKTLAERIPELRMIEPEGTYLVWIDFSGLFENQRELEIWVRGEAGLWLDSGSKFSCQTPLFQRINIACPRSILEKALGQLAQAVEKRRTESVKQS